MAEVMAVIFHHAASAEDGPLTAILARAREALAAHHARLFRRAGARVVLAEAGSGSGSGGTFGEALAHLVGRHARAHGAVVLGSGAVPLLRGGEARALVAVAGGAKRRALTNDRWSSDVCAVARAATLVDLPALTSDNALPRWLAGQGYEVRELPARRRLGLDLDSPLDLALLALDPELPRPLRRIARAAALHVPGLTELRAVAADPAAELLVAGRSSSATLRWLERRTRCRVRFLAEERGLRSGAALPVRDARGATQRAPRSVLGRLVEARGPAALADTVAELADAAVIDSRVLLADRLGADERAWPTSEDRFASDLLRTADVGDPWLRALTAAAAGAGRPILLGGHTTVGPGLPRLLRGPAHRRRLGGRRPHEPRSPRAG